MNASASPLSLVQAHQLSKHIVTPTGEHLSILNHINLNINAGESLAIMGRSGSGKSTLLGLLAGLDIPSEGEVILAGQRLNDLNEDERARFRSMHVGFVFQQFYLLPAFTALENVLLPLELKGVPDALEQAKDWLSHVGLSNRMSHTPRQLSGGEQQRVAVARAFAGNPSIIFADEPTGSLDARTRDQMIKLIFETQKQYDTTLILVTHDEPLSQHCTRHIQLEAGEMVKK